MGALINFLVLLVLLLAGLGQTHLAAAERRLRHRDSAGRDRLRARDRAVPPTQVARYSPALENPIGFSGPYQNRMACGSTW